MHPITLFTLVIATIYLSTSLFRLYQYVREVGLFSNHLNTRLCWIGLFSGFTYLLGNYDIQRYLHAYLEVLPFPISALLWILTGVLGTSYLFISAVNRYTIFNITDWIGRVLIVSVGILILANLIWYPHIPFDQLQVIDGLIGAILCIIAAMSVAPMMNIVLKREQESIHRVQFLLTMIQLSAATATALLLVVDSVYKLWFDIYEIYTPIYILTAISHSIQIIVTHLMNEGIGIYWNNYPSKLRYYLKLKRLYAVIQDIIHMPDTYNIPLPTIPLPHSIDTMTYRVFIKITDRYWRIDSAHPLRHQIEQILRLDIPQDLMLQQLGEIETGKEQAL